MKSRSRRRYFTLPYAFFLALFVIVPLFLIVYYAFSDSTGQLSLNALMKFFKGPGKLTVIIVSLFIAVQTTLLCLLIGYPIAWFLADRRYNKSAVLVMLFIMPMWINFVLRTGATRDVLFFIGLNGGNAPYLTTLIGMVYNYLPFAILPLYTTMLKIDHSQMEAAADLGADPFRVFLLNVIPQTRPGIISAVTMILVPVMSSYVISTAMSEGNITLIGNSIYLNFANNQWNDGSFLAFILLLAVIAMMFLDKDQKKTASMKGGVLS